MLNSLNSLNSLTDAYDEGTIYMALGVDGYVGLVRVEGGRFTIAAALDPHATKRCGGVGATVARILRDAGLPDIFQVESLHWQGTPALTRRVHRLAIERALVLGDAAGYIEPFTGEGIAWAIDSAIALAPLVHRAVRSWDHAVGTEWVKIHRKTVARRQIVCRLISRVLRHPTLCDVLVRILSQAPSVAAPFVRRIHSAYRR